MLSSNSSQSKVIFLIFQVSNQEVTEYCRNFQQKMACLVSTDPPIEGEELVALGAKEPDAEVEKFIAANTQELAKDKWLCPLSGKKFKGPEFVRKHIFNKHAEKVEEVKKEVCIHLNISLMVLVGSLKPTEIFKFTFFILFLLQPAFFCSLFLLFSMFFQVVISRFFFITRSSFFYCLLVPSHEKKIVI